MRALGFRIELRPEIRVTHLKRWTLGDVLRTDFRDRGVAWTRLLLRERSWGSADGSGLASGTGSADGTSRADGANGADRASGSARASRTALNLARRERWCAGLAVGATAVGGAALHFLHYLTAAAAAVTGAVLHAVGVGDASETQRDGDSAGDGA